MSFPRFHPAWPRWGPPCLYCGFYWVRRRTVPSAVWERQYTAWCRASTLSGSLFVMTLQFTLSRITVAGHIISKSKKKIKSCRYLTCCRRTFLFHYLYCTIVTDNVSSRGGNWYGNVRNQNNTRSAKIHSSKWRFRSTCWNPKFNDWLM